MLLKNTTFEKAVRNKESVRPFLEEMVALTQQHHEVEDSEATDALYLTQLLSFSQFSSGSYELAIHDIVNEQGQCEEQVLSERPLQTQLSMSLDSRLDKLIQSNKAQSSSAKGVKTRLKKLGLKFLDAVDTDTIKFSLTRGVMFSLLKNKNVDTTSSGLLRYLNVRSKGNNQYQMDTQSVALCNALGKNSMLKIDQSELEKELSTMASLENRDNLMKKYFCETIVHLQKAIGGMAKGTKPTLEEIAVLGNIERQERCLMYNQSQETFPNGPGQVKSANDTIPNIEFPMNQMHRTGFDSLWKSSLTYTTSADWGYLEQTKQSLDLVSPQQQQRNLNEYMRRIQLLKFTSSQGLNMFRLLIRLNMVRSQICDEDGYVDSKEKLDEGIKLIKDGLKNKSSYDDLVQAIQDWVSDNIAYIVEELAPGGPIVEMVGDGCFGIKSYYFEWQSSDKFPIFTLINSQAANIQAYQMVNSWKKEREDLPNIRGVLNRKDDDDDEMEEFLDIESQSDFSLFEFGPNLGRRNQGIVMNIL